MDAARTTTDAAIMQQIGRRSEADPAETTFDATDEKVLGQLNARLA